MFFFRPIRNYENVVDESESIFCFVKDVLQDLLKFGWHDCQSVKISVECVRSSLFSTYNLEVTVLRGFRV